MNTYQFIPGNPGMPAFVRLETDCRTSLGLPHALNVLLGSGEQHPSVGGVLPVNLRGVKPEIWQGPLPLLAKEVTDIAALFAAASIILNAETADESEINRIIGECGHFQRK